MSDSDATWGQGAVNNNIDWGAGASTNSISWSMINVLSYGNPRTNLVGSNLGLTYITKSQNDGGSGSDITCVNITLDQLNDILT